MRDQRAGMATFIPLDTIIVKPINDRYRSLASGARLAIDVIQYEPALDRALHYACGNALICDTMEIAKDICYRRGQEVKGTARFLADLWCSGISLIKPTSLCCMYCSRDTRWHDYSQKREHDGWSKWYHFECAKMGGKGNRW